MDALGAARKMKGAFWAIVIRNSCMEWVLSEQTLELIRGEGSRNTTRVQALVSHLASTMVTERGFMRIRDQRGTTRTSGCSTLSSWETPTRTGDVDTHEYHEVKVDNVGRRSEEGGSLAVSLHTPIFFQVQRHFSMSSQAKKGRPTLRSAKVAHIPRGWRCDRLAVLQVPLLATSSSTGLSRKSCTSSWAHVDTSGRLSLAPSGFVTVFDYKTGDTALLKHEVVLNLEDWRCLPAKEVSLHAGWAQGHR